MGWPNKECAIGPATGGLDTGPLNSFAQADRSLYLVKKDPVKTPLLCTLKRPLWFRPARTIICVEYLRRSRGQYSPELSSKPLWNTAKWVTFLPLGATNSKSQSK